VSDARRAAVGLLLLLALSVAALCISIVVFAQTTPAKRVISLDDLDQCADLLAEFALGIEADADFTPK